MSTLMVENVTYRYKKNQRFILNGVNCSFESGKIYAIVGKSGSGKTTMLSVLAGFDSPTSGTIYYNGKAITGDTLEEYRKKNVSYIFQDYQLFPKLTVMENVVFPLELNGVNKSICVEKAGKILAKMGIDESLWNRFPAQLSGGEQQRVAISRALALGGKIMLADEPTGNLDHENGRRTIELLKKLVAEEDICIIIVTHDLSIPEQCDCVYEMADGKVTTGK